MGRSMTKADSKYLAIPAAIAGAIALGVLLLSSLGFVKRDELMEVKEEQAAINVEILRRLDCALFDLPRGCKENMAPR